jgi:hypothetical protein
MNRREERKKVSLRVKNKTNGMFGKEEDAVILGKFGAKALNPLCHGYIWEYWR